ncbi:MAG: conjugal transfer protein TraI [Alphaproteobacteria bacterium]|nr:conjugal transfer protein TraI [Alphaproteobacteria bacterium]
MIVVGKENMHLHRESILSMHALRKRVFIDKLNWPVGTGITVRNGMEIDDFDTVNAYYIISHGQDGEVNACQRLIPTVFPYLLGEKFGDWVDGKMPSSSDIWEVSRFAADTDKVDTPKNIIGALIAAMLEYGVARDFAHYVSISDVRIEPLLKRAGWDPKRLGKPLPTQTDTAAGEIYTVSTNMLERVKEKSKISGDVITNWSELDLSSMSQNHERKVA